MALSRPKHGFESRWGRHSQTLCLAELVGPPFFSSVFSLSVAVPVFVPVVYGVSTRTARDISAPLGWAYRSSIPVAWLRTPSLICPYPCAAFQCPRRLSSNHSLSDLGGYHAGPIVLDKLWYVGTAKVVRLDQLRGTLSIRVNTPPSAGVDQAVSCRSGQRPDL